jgi:hypothetical protein
MIARYLDDKLTVIVLTNGDSANPGAIAQGIAEAYIPGLIPHRTIAKVDPKIFDAYVGQYQPNPVVTLILTREGDKLMFQESTTSDKREMLPESETSFFTQANRLLTYSFAKDEKGQVTHLVVQNDGREVARAKKIK